MDENIICASRNWYLVKLDDENTLVLPRNFSIYPERKDKFCVIVKEERGLQFYGSLELTEGLKAQFRKYAKRPENHPQPPIDAEDDEDCPILETRSWFVIRVTPEDLFIVPKNRPDRANRVGVASVEDNELVFHGDVEILTRTVREQCRDYFHGHGVLV